MNSPRARITISNAQGLERSPLKGWKFQPETVRSSAWAERGARRSTSSTPAITQTNIIAIDRFIAVSLNLSIAIMFVCVIAGVELVDRLAPRSAQALLRTVSGWNFQPLSGERSSPWALLIVILALGLFMAWISVKEGHLAIIAGFLSVT